MKTIIKIKTYMCPLGVGKLGQEGACRFHLDKNGVCPIHKQELQLTTLPEDKMTITIIGEEEVDVMEKEDPTTKQKVSLTKAEKDALKAKIQADIIKFNAMK